MLLLALPVILLACTVSYKFNGASINYDKVKTISIADFPIKSAYVYQPLANKFNDDLKDIFTRQTRLQLVRNANADLQIEGEITGINVYNEAVSADGFSSKAKVTVIVNVRFVNNTNHAEDFEQQFSAFRSDLDPNSYLPNIPDATIAEITKEITDQIFNATVANW